ncbi:hypothetical protein DKT77_02990 [Meridianimarinicoccus roseus]|uniref:Protein ImuA n=1 Tax=Meridianimarinicoccus roseus TaxID=2072018 RepID=A0A2V2LP66_9RHOB|nr:hypothetical protein [Meridianimarinicoccus roseus]PWR04029.1 hypothetical protein DKT77_02990 [Meridianimarinicoccus roseus]
MEDLRLHMAPKRPVPHLPVLGDMTLRLGRVHEFCGPARRTLALRVAAKLDGPVIWIRPGWQAERLNPEGVLPLGVEPGRLIFVDPRRAEDILWSAEEALRCGAVALVVCELHALPGLTPVRRLHLAAEAGAEAMGTAPLGLLLAQANGGVPGVESRWYMTFAHGLKEEDGWRLERRRARTDPPAAWHVDARGETRPLGAPRGTG